MLINQAAWRLQPRTVLFVYVGTVHSMYSLVMGTYSIVAKTSACGSLMSQSFCAITCYAL